jgi:hypothetical protein
MQVGGANAATGTVDFIVDTFDRASGGELGDLWTNPDAFVLDSGNAKGALEGKGSWDATYRPVYTRKLPVGAFSLSGVANRVVNVDSFYDDGVLVNLLLGVTRNSVLSGYQVIAIGTRHSGGTSGLTAISISTFDNTQLVFSGLSPTLPSATEAFSVVYDGETLTVSCFGLEVSYAVGVISPYIGMRSQYSYSASNNQYHMNIQYLKAWSASIPEPPDAQSGHGNYVDGQFIYTDKYHAGGGYNPNA